MNAFKDENRRLTAQKLLSIEDKSEMKTWHLGIKIWASDKPVGICLGTMGPWSPVALWEQVSGSSWHLLHFSPLPLAPGLSLDLATPTELPSVLSGPVDGGDSLFSPQLPLCSAESPSTAEFHLVLGTDSAWSTATLASVQPLLLIPQSNISQQLKQPPWSNLKQTAPVGTAACSHLEGEAVCTEASAVSAICMNKQLWRVQLKLLCKHSPKYVLCCIIPSNKDSGTGIWLSVLLMLHGVQ